MVLPGSLVPLALIDPRNLVTTTVERRGAGAVAADVAGRVRWSICRESDI